MAEELLETVERLQSRLLDKVEPRKLLKTLKRLGELPMTVDILVETGVGRTVNSLRKNELAGDLAKHLVAKWKRLVPTPADRPREPEPHGAPRSSEGRGRREPTPEEEEEEEEEQEPSYVDEDDEMEEKRYRGDYSPSPPPPTRRYSPGQRAPDGGQRGGYQSEGYESPEPEPSPPPPPPPPPPPRSKEVKHKEAGRTHHGDREEERRRRLAEGGGGGRSNSDRKRRGTAREQPSGGQRVARQSSHRKERKGSHDAGRSRELRDSPGEEEEAEEFDTPTMSFESFLTYDAPTPVKKKKKLPPPGRPPHAASSSSQRSHPPAAVASSSSSSSSSKASRSNGTRAKRPEPGPATARSAPEKRRRAVEVVVALPEIPLPAIQPNYRPLPSIDLTPLSPQRRKVPVSNDEEDSGFTGRRFNSKMSVYSGAKTAFLPKMMSLYEQCIRVLQNNIDSIDEVGGVPFEILEPVLERCTPEQLYRIEQCNQCFTEDSDDLWMRHCRRDFKREAPQEYESWRETYLRLHDEREERLRMLTQNISSAHANKPKGRQVKLAFVNSVAKPPRDVRRRQEKFGTTSTSTASSTAAAAPIKIRPASSYSSHSAEPGCSSSHLSPSPSSRASGSSGGGGGGGGGGHTPRDNKPQVKKIAPMMAKTIKAFKNRFSRR